MMKRGFRAAAALLLVFMLGASSAVYAETASVSSETAEAKTEAVSGGAETVSAAATEDLSTPTGAMDAYLKQLRREGLEAIQSDVLAEDEGTLDDITSLDKELTETLVEKFSEFDYTISNETIDGETAAVDVTVTTYNFGKCLENVINETMAKLVLQAFSSPSEEEIQEMILEIVRDEISGLKKEYEKTVTVTLTKEGDVWTPEKLTGESPLLDALSGGLISTIEDYDYILSAVSDGGE